MLWLQWLEEVAELAGDGFEGVLAVVGRSGFGGWHHPATYAPTNQIQPTHHTTAGSAPPSVSASGAGGLGMGRRTGSGTRPWRHGWRRMT
jgi:hypothetical protein